MVRIESVEQTIIGVISKFKELFPRKVLKFIRLSGDKDGMQTLMKTDEVWVNKREQS